MWNMRRYLILSAALLALAAWSGKSFGRDKDSGNDSQTNASDSASNETQSSAQNRNDRQDRENADDAQHHAALGISMTDSDGHVRVAAVMPGSPAARAGLQVGDEIRAVDDQRIRTADELTEEIGEQQPGANVELSIRRNGERRTLHARLASSQEANRWRNNRQVASNAGNDEYNNRGYRQDGWNRNRASSYDPDSQLNSQAINQQLRQMRQQVAQLQQEVDELRNQSANTRLGNRNRANNASRDGGQGSGNDRQSGQNQD
jgi:PDZ domain